MNHKITSYQILRHGVEHSQYFQGCGTSFTSFDNADTGIGDTEKEAFEDALECIAMSESFEAGEIERLESENTEWDSRDVQTVLGASDEDMEDSECHWHVSIRYNTAPVCESIPA